MTILVQPVRMWSVARMPWSGRVAAMMVSSGSDVVKNLPILDILYHRPARCGILDVWEMRKLWP